MARTQDLRRRLRGVGNTRKITHAMELVAATKMRRAMAAVLATRRYAELAWELLREVQRRSGVAHHPLLAGRSPVRGALALVVAGNRGLVGAFNQRIVSLVRQAVAAEGVPVRLVTTGRVAARLLQRAGLEIAADFPKQDLLADPAEAAPLAAMLTNSFMRGDADRVRMVYADFRSVTRQEPRVRTLLPVGEPDSLLGEVRNAGATGDAMEGPTARTVSEGSRPYLFEPSPREVLEAVVPNLVSIQIYQALLETTASEHAARMVAMKNATDNADELRDDLTLALNQVRQQQITRELQEIVSGALV